MRRWRKRKAKTMLKKVILCPNPYRDHELTVAKEAKRILDSVHCPNVVCVPFRNEEKPEGYGLDIRPLQQELRGADMIIAFGGDGTILHASKAATKAGIPVLGVNIGTMGFMAELEQKELGRLDAPGRPIVFGTTEEFLRNFGVDSTDNLPEISPVKMEDFRAEVEEEMQIKLDV